VWSLRGLRLTGENAAANRELQQKHFSLGERFLRLGDMDNAEKELKRAIELDRESDLARQAAGYLETIEARRSSAPGQQGEQNAG
jgi:Tfp pilus assembly protein PilF